MLLATVRRLQRADDDEAVHFVAVDLDQSAGGHIKVGEGLGVRDVRQRAVESVRPAVIAAHQGVSTAGSFDEGHPAVPARVAEHACPTVPAPHREQRHAEGDAFGVVAGVGDGRGRQVDARKRAQHLELSGESDWVQIVLDRFAPGIAFIGCACVDVREDAANDLRIVGDRRLCRSAHTVEVSHFISRASMIL